MLSKSPVSKLARSLYKCAAFQRVIFGASATGRPFGTIHEATKFLPVPSFYLVQFILSSYNILVLYTVQYRHLIPALVSRTSASAWWYNHS